MVQKLRYTGHPFVDVGVAAITAFAERTSPEDVTSEDLERMAEFIEQNYVKPPLRGHLTMAFTSNAWFIQDAYNPDKPGLSEEERAGRKATRKGWADRHLRQWQAVVASDTERCVFTGEPAISTNLSGKLSESRAGRAQMPLLQGDDSINFFTYGDPGLPVSGTALLALQFFPLGCAKCGNGLLAVHSDNNYLTSKLTSRFLRQNISAMTQAQVAGEDKLPSAQRSLKTLLVEELLAAERERGYAQTEQEPASLTAYNFNNGKSVELQLYHLPLEIVQFIRVAQTVTYQAAWNQLVHRAWQLARIPKGKQAQEKAEIPQESRRNFLYEDLFELPQDAARFIRTYFLRLPKRTTFEDDPRREYSPRKDVDLILWLLVELFLEKVVRMDKTRIEDIRTLGDKLALYVRRQGGKRFFLAFYTENSAANFRWRLIKANMEHIKDGQAPLFDMDTYIEVFEEGYEVMRPDWRLARDLVLMRMIDQLKDWLAQNPDAIPETEAEREPVAVAAQQG
jgi:CRISPR-associated protein Cst1